MAKTPSRLRSITVTSSHRVRSRAARVFAVGALCWTAACGPTPQDFDSLAQAALPQIEGAITVPGLEGEVEVIRDRWGVPHIYADSQEDLFFAQGFVQAQDRLWQMDMYRRAGEGRLAEILGPEAIQHDRAARLIKYRGPWTDAEFNSYHPQGRQILEAFSAGVNAYIRHATSAGELPVEYELTGLTPEEWSIETPLLRIATAMPTRDARGELSLARDVAEMGAAEANRRARPTPYRDLIVPQGVDYSIIGNDVADVLSDFTGTIVRPPLVAPYDAWEGANASAHLGARENSPGSNNWAISPSLTATGAAIVANDPHRGVTNPSLRYMVHLDAPGWTAIGSTEPVLPGVAIGHNGSVGWGLTIVGTDQSDVYVEEVNPEDPNQVRWNGGWEALRIEHDTIVVKGASPEVVELKFSRHGPIFYEDFENNRAYAMRSTMHEPGSTGYLSGLRLNTAVDCMDFLDALSYWFAPTENMVCGDSTGNIAWQASALSPDRGSKWHGRLPVPGTGEYEWVGFRDDLPRELNPERGWVGTANHDIHPEGYDPPLFFKTEGPFERFERVSGVLGSDSAFTVQDSRELQHDAYLASALPTIELYRGWTSGNAELETYRQELAAWDAVFDKSDRAAAVYGQLSRALTAGGADPATASQADLEAALERALGMLRAEQGDDPAQWRWGRTHRSEFPHSLVSAYDLPAIERMGGAGTVAATGATYREIIDFSNLDGSLATNAPGQSGRPGSPFYGNLAEPWGNGEYFPMSFSREAVEANAQYRLRLVPN